MDIKKAEAICQEFCDEVLVGGKVHCSSQLSLADEPLQFEMRDEIKCQLDIDHFTGLVERMVQEGYCCTQVQKDLKTDKCTAWFEPQSLT